ncbi:hypothetical protein [Pedobacter frigiditerrae]|uniref:hypothetical protein n=1 Tax=Pedobacter frigiditerrae TaxID=2530452 RepID=UPI0029309695|nr:hypothetical protein [Pedobacter frigiditerrae]
MKKLKNIALQIGLCIILFLLIKLFKLDYFGIYIIISPFFAYALFDYIKYKRGSVGYIAFPREDDSSSQMIALIMGVLMTITAIFYTELNTQKLLLICAGSIIFLNGIFMIPSIRLSIAEGNITITGLDNQIALNQINSIEILSDRIVINKMDEKKHLVRYLELSPKYSDIIEAYLLKHTVQTKIKIANKTSSLTSI